MKEFFHHASLVSAHPNTLHITLFSNYSNNLCMHQQISHSSPTITYLHIQHSSLNILHLRILLNSSLTILHLYLMLFANCVPVHITIFHKISAYCSCHQPRHNCAYHKQRICLLHVIQCIIIHPDINFHWFG